MLSDILYARELAILTIPDSRAADLIGYIADIGGLNIRIHKS